MVTGHLRRNVHLESSRKTSTSSDNEAGVERNRLVVKEQRMNETESSTHDLAAVAERLRAVKAAQRRFLRLWGIEQAMINPLLDRVADDLARAAASSADVPAGRALTDVPADISDLSEGGWIAGDGWSMNG
jgi:hypothetical protein